MTLGLVCVEDAAHISAGAIPLQAGWTEQVMTFSHHGWNQS